MAHFYLCYGNKNDSFVLKKNCTIFMYVCNFKMHVCKRNVTFSKSLYKYYK